MAIPAAVFFSGPALATVYADENALQTAINTALPGDVIDITGSGTIDITVTLTIPVGIILKSTDNSKLQATSAFSATTVTPTDPQFMDRTFFPMINVSAGGVTISGITVSGITDGSANTDGIYSTGNITIQNVTVQNMNTHNPLNGVINGNGIIIAGTADADITGCTIRNFTKNGIDFGSTGTLTASGNTITGAGSNPGVAAQNGILVRAGDATLTGNTISGMRDNNPTPASSGILAIGGTVEASGNTIANSDIAVSSDDTYTASGVATPSITGNRNTFIDVTQGVVSQGGATADLTDTIVVTTPPANNNVPVPTLGEDVMTALALLLAALGALTLRRRAPGTAAER